jgi:hypothetical protein
MLGHANAAFTLSRYVGVRSGADATTNGLTEGVVTHAARSGRRRRYTGGGVLTAAAVVESRWAER